MSANQPDPSSPGFGRRLAALTYDSMLVVAIVMAATALLLPITGGEAIDGMSLGTALYQIYLLAVVFGFFAICWTRGGQTLGMRAWRLRLLRADGRGVTLRDAGLRYVAALMAWIPLVLVLLYSYQLDVLWLAWVPVTGVFLWSLGGRERPAWHERLSRTRMLLEPTPPKT